MDIEAKSREANEKHLYSLSDKFKRGKADAEEKRLLAQAGIIESNKSVKEHNGQLTIPKKYQKRTNIERKEWMPKDRINHTDEFFDWVNSFTFGFSRIKLSMSHTNYTSSKPWTGLVKKLIRWTIKNLTLSFMID